MTEQEAIDLLRNIQNKPIDYAEMVGAPYFAYGIKFVYPEPEDYAIDIAISALEEIQQYQALGTVEELRKAKEKQLPKKPKFVRVADKNKNQYLCPNCKIGMYHYLDEERK